MVAAAHADDPTVYRRLIGSREIDDAGGRDFPTLAHLQSRDPATEITLSCNALESHKRWVLAGIGIAILPEFVVAAELAAGALRVVDASWAVEARLDVVRVHGRRATPQVAAALDVMTEVFASPDGRAG